MTFRSTRRLIIITVAILCMGVTSVASAIDDYAPPGPPSAVAMGADALVIRPLSLATTVAGAGIFLVSLPFSLLGMNVGQAGNRLVAEPAEYTFARPLGDFQTNSPKEADTIN